MFGRSVRAMRETFLSLQQETDKMRQVENVEEPKYLTVAKGAIGDNYIIIENMEF